jgi:pyruvate dehydrogenase E1 component beta subunit
MTLNEAILSGVYASMDADPSVYVIGQDIGPFGGPMQSAAGLWDRYGATGRIIDAPISEAAMVATAVGAAMTGSRPIVDLMFAEFLNLVMTPLALEGASVRFKSNGLLSVPLVVRVKYGVGPHHGHAETCYNALVNYPGIKVVAPTTPQDGKGLMIAAVRDDDPVVVFEHMSLLHGPRDEVPDGADAVPIGLADVRRSGSDVTVAASGLMVSRAVRAANQLARQGIEVEVIDVRTLTPLDTTTIGESVARTGRLLVVDEAWPFGGVAAEIVSSVATNPSVRMTAPIRRLQPPSLPVPFGHLLERAFVPDETAISRAVEELVSGEVRTEEVIAG